MALLARDECLHQLGLRGEVHTNCGGVIMNIFKQTLPLALATVKYHDVASIGEVGHMGVGSNLIPWVIL